MTGKKSRLNHLVRPGHRVLDRGPNFRQERLQQGPAVGGKFHEGQAATGKILLLPEVLVGQDQNIEDPVHQPYQVTIRNARPTLSLKRRHRVRLEQLPEGGGYIFIEQDLHGCRSRTRRRKS